MSFVIFRDNQAAGCILVESMYDAWSFYAADPGKLALAVVEKGVYQRTIMVANVRVYHHSVFLVDDYHVLILKKDLQWNLLGLRLCGHCFGNIDADVVALLDPIARSLGLSHFTILFRHILPNCIGPIIVYTTLTIPGVMLFEAVLSFLGLGLKPPNSSWGVLIKEGSDMMLTNPWLLLFPSLFFSVTLLSLNFLGDGLRDALDPKSSKD